MTFNGAKRSAERLGEIFAPLKEAGIALLVIPGNHDIYDGWARSFSGSEERRVAQISPADWKEIFSASYDLAASQEPGSLSYSVNLNPHWRLLLLDSNLYSSQFSYTHPMTSGGIDDGERRLGVFHHPILPHRLPAGLKLRLYQADDPRPIGQE